MTSLRYGELNRAYSTQDIERHADAAGSYFFDPATMRFFGSRILGDAYPVAGYDASVFVTSERDRDGAAWNGQRRYSVRIAYIRANVQPDAGRECYVPAHGFTIDPLGEFGAYPTASAAKRAAVTLAKLGGSLKISEYTGTVADAVRTLGS